jgi:hypothetical protein
MPNFAPIVKAGAKGVDYLVDALRSAKPATQESSNMFLPDFTQTMFKKQAPDASMSALNNPVTLKDGTRLSGFTDPINQTVFHGYDKNGARLTIARDAIDPFDIVFSKDSNKTAETLKNALDVEMMKRLGNFKE